MPAAKVDYGKEFVIVGETPITTSFTVSTQNDWVVFPCAGVLHLEGVTVYDGGLETSTYTHPTLTVNNGAGYNTSATSIAYDGATANTRKAAGYLVVNDATGEIMYVEKDSAPTSTSGTLTVRRGALGTEPAVITDNDVLYVLCTVVATSSNTGTHFVRYHKLPDDPKVLFY